MKKIIATTFCTLMISGLLLAIGTVMAAEPGYERTEWVTQVIPTIDGMWTTDDEWTDGEPTQIGTDVVFRSTHDGNFIRWIVEFLTDTTDDSGDYLRFCLDLGGGTESTSPNLSHRKVEITGHTNFTYYFGYEDDWLESDAEWLEWAASINVSPTSSTPHWIYEFQIDKEYFLAVPFQDIWYIFLQVYDASNSGTHAWPPAADPDVPRGWGTNISSTSVIPEGLTFAVMALLTTVSMLVGYKYFIKRKETK